MKPLHSENDLHPSIQISEPAYTQEIRVRAYELFEQRGKEPGHDLDDWLQAEGELVMRTRSQMRGVAA
jgi:hypothetical protein